MGTVRLRVGRVKAIWSGHPWVYAQAVASIDGAPGVGDEVNVVDPEGKFLGRGYYSPKSAIPVRIMSRDPEARLTEAFLARRIDVAVALRRQLGFPSAKTTGYRLIQAEGDGLPGLIADMFGDVLVVQILTAGMNRRKDVLIAHLARASGARSVVLAPVSQRKPEGFEHEWQVVRGPEVQGLSFLERGFEFSVPAAITQKTGYYFDQRDNRARVEALASGRRVLDAYAFLGGMGLAAARGGASEVLSVDSSAAAITAGSMIAHHNQCEITFRREDIKKYLPKLHNEGRRFDMVIVDPPKLAPTRRHREAGLRAYRALNQRAAALVEENGILVSCSCSGAISMDDLLLVVAQAARKAGRQADVLHLGGQGVDHPTPAAFREGRYLKAVFARLSKD